MGKKTIIPVAAEKLFSIFLKNQTREIKSGRLFYFEIQ
jgi:hypothetical protein